MNNLRLIPETHRQQEIINAFVLLENITNEVFDSSRYLLFIRAGKGVKDRQSIVSEYLFNDLRNYSILFKPKKWVFEGGKWRAI